MLVDALKILEEESNHAGCAAGTWISQQEPEVQELLNKLGDNPNVSLSKLYKTVSSEHSGLPFKRTTFITHMSGMCVCP